MKFRKEKRSNKSKFGWTRNNNIERTFPLEILVVTKYQSEIRDAMNYIINQYELCDIGYTSNILQQIQTIDARYSFASTNSKVLSGYKFDQILYLDYLAFSDDYFRLSITLPSLLRSKVPKEFQEIVLEY